MTKGQCKAIGIVCAIAAGMSAVVTALGCIMMSSGGGRNALYYQLMFMLTVSLTLVSVFQMAMCYLLVLGASNEKPGLMIGFILSTVAWLVLLIIPSLFYITIMTNWWYRALALIFMLMKICSTEYYLKIVYFYHCELLAKKAIQRANTAVPAATEAQVAEQMDVKVRF